MGKKRISLKEVFNPPADASRIRKWLPYLLILGVGIVLILGATVSWEVTNSTSFCGLTCHTMPPEYTTHQISAHARVTCDDCHMGRASLPIQIYRKIDYGQGTFFGMVFHTYEYPIIAKRMRPANDACETCHYPQQFSNDTLVTLKHYDTDPQNTLSTTYLILKTGGGSKRQGLGLGIHWHVENPVYFVAEDAGRQKIPYIRVMKDDGTYTEYIDTESNFDPASIQAQDLQRMDCITCHNQAAHPILQPEDSVDQAMGRGEISPTIPEIRKKAVEVLRVDYPDVNTALSEISKLSDYYTQKYPEFVSKNNDLVQKAVEVVKGIYQTSVFPDQKDNWDAHPNNLAHKDTPGCFRCHDGKHLSVQGEAVRLECNLCHSIPVVSGSNQIVNQIEVSQGFEPDNHKNSNWITIHHQAFNESCAACHTVTDPGGSSNQSFCSNSGCHANKWVYAGFDAPKLREKLGDLVKEIAPTPKPTPIPETIAVNDAAVPTTYNNGISLLFNKCSSCHGPTGMKGVNLSSYASIMAGGDSGPLLVAGDPANSLLVKVQSAAQPHFGQLTATELEWVVAWIKAGAPEK